MNYSDYIKMTQCEIYSISFATDNLIETLEKAELVDKNGERFEIVKNLLTDKKVMKFEDGGLFFSIRAEFKQASKEQIAYKALEFKREGKNEKEAMYLAKMAVFKVLPPSSEIFNIFYNPNNKTLIINSNSKRSKTALIRLIEVFGLAGVQSIIISQEKLGINQKFNDYLNHGSPLFNAIGFDFSATVYKSTDDDESIRTCRHLDTNDGIYNALQAIKDGFSVQSLAMRYEDEDKFIVRFKLDKNLRIRAMKFRDYATTSRMLRSDSPVKEDILMDYLQQQYRVLNRIVKNTVLEFTQETKLETFI
ncbi:hypothetical protein ACLSYX_10610 [[Pasteurella] aerogenes]